MAACVVNSRTINLSDFAWNYRGEGNGSIVIALPESGQILRLVKVATDGDGGDSYSLMHVNSDRLVALQSFIADTVGPLVGSTFVLPGEIVRLTAQDAKLLNRHLRPHRPAFRLHKQLPEGDVILAQLLPDLCSSKVLLDRCPAGIRLLGSVYCVEIKPKLGFNRCSNPEAGHVTKEAEKEGSDSVDNFSPGLAVCKYHLTQLKKLAEGKVSSVSGYCPLDLFSGCPHRMLVAIQELVKNPQNNFQIFRDGQLIYGSGIGGSGSLEEELAYLFKSSSFPSKLTSTDRLGQLLVRVLLDDHCGAEKTVALPKSPPLLSSDHCKRRCGCIQSRGVSLADFPHCDAHATERAGDEFVAKQLPPGSILEGIFRMQQLSTVEGNALLPTHRLLLEQTRDLAPDRLNQWLYGPQGLSESTLLSSSESLREAVSEIRNHLLSRTASDCSVLVTLSRVDNSATPVAESEWLLQDVDKGSADSGSSLFAHCVAVVDTDWKPITRLPFWARETELLLGFQPAVASSSQN